MNAMQANKAGLCDRSKNKGEVKGIRVKGRSADSAEGPPGVGKDLVAGAAVQPLRELHHVLALHIPAPSKGERPCLGLCSIGIARSPAQLENV